MAPLPYVPAPGSIPKTLKAIQEAATPEKVSEDFVKTVLGIAGGTGDQMTSFLKKIQFATTDGTPTDLYRAFRNKSQSGRAMAEALKKAYAPLYARNEFMHQLPDAQLKGLIVEETGQASDSKVVGLILSCIKYLKEFADFSSSEIAPQAAVLMSQVGTEPEGGDHNHPHKSLGLNLSYTINLNLPATSDVAVFNAIFRSLKENLLRS